MLAVYKGILLPAYGYITSSTTRDQDNSYRHDKMTSELLIFLELGSPLYNMFQVKSDTRTLYLVECSRMFGTECIGRFHMSKR